MLELRVSPGGRRFLVWRTASSIPAVQVDRPQLLGFFSESLGIGRGGRKTVQQLQNEKIQLYAQLGSGSGAPEVVDGICERIGAQIQLLSEKIAAEVQTPRQMSKALVPVASAQV